jgi:putative hydrolase of HD superfamily
MAFLDEVEKLKVVYRRNQTIDQSRPESTAEHSWHVALSALLLSEHADDNSLDLFKVVKMLLIHDLVEVYAGDTWLYDSSADQRVREDQSADALFSILPDDQAEDIRQLWDEFESNATAEAQYAAGIDALQPLSNWLLAGKVDEHHKQPRQSEVLQRKRHIERASSALWQLAQGIISRSTSKGLYRS